VHHRVRRAFAPRHCRAEPRSICEQSVSGESVSGRRLSVLSTFYRLFGLRLYVPRIFFVWIFFLSNHPALFALRPYETSCL
jgi:hypothetical protein